MEFQPGNSTWGFSQRAGISVLCTPSLSLPPAPSGAGVILEWIWGQHLRLLLWWPYKPHFSLLRFVSKLCLPQVVADWSLVLHFTPQHPSLDLLEIPYFVCLTVNLPFISCIHCVPQISNFKSLCLLMLEHDSVLQALVFIAVSQHSLWIATCWHMEYSHIPWCV